MVESVNILVNSNGQIIRSDVVGALKMRTYLRLMFYLYVLELIAQIQDFDMESYTFSVDAVAFKIYESINWFVFLSKMKFFDLHYYKKVGTNACS